MPISLGSPRELFEAATVDGASAWRRYRSLALPLSGPALMTLGSLVFVWLWNEFLFAAVILSSASTMTLVVDLSIVVGERFVADFQQVAAGMLITMIPPIFIFWLQRGISQGITAGAVRMSRWAPVERSRQSGSVSPLLPSPPEIQIERPAQRPPVAARCVAPH